MIRRLPARLLPLGALLLLLLLSLPGALPAWAEDLTVTGTAVDQAGAPVAGAMVSDGHDALLTKADGTFTLTTQPGRVVWLAAPAGSQVAGRWWWPAAQAAAQPLKVALAPAPGQTKAALAVLSDPHLMDATCPPKRYAPPESQLGVPMATWGKLAAKVKEMAPALTLVTGDLCSDADRGDQAHAATQMALAAKAMAMLPGPARALAGNHDVRYSPGKADLDLWREHMGPARQVYQLPQATVILIDNTGVGTTAKNPSRSCGNTSPEALQWLRKVLGLIPLERGIIVVSHYPLLSPISGLNPLFRHTLVNALNGDGQALRNTDQALFHLAHLLAGRNIIALINGHEHAAQESVISPRGRPWRFFGAPAVCGAWWRGDRPLGPLSFPPAWMWLDLEPAGQTWQPRATFHTITF